MKCLFLFLILSLNSTAQLPIPVLNQVLGIKRVDISKVVIGPTLFSDELQWSLIHSSAPFRPDTSIYASYFLNTQGYVDSIHYYELGNHIRSHQFEYDKYNRIINKSYWSYGKKQSESAVIIMSDGNFELMSSDDDLDLIIHEIASSDSTLLKRINSRSESPKYLYEYIPAENTVYYNILSNAKLDFARKEFWKHNDDGTDSVFMEFKNFKDPLKDGTPQVWELCYVADSSGLLRKIYGTHLVNPVFYKNLKKTTLIRFNHQFKLDSHKIVVRSERQYRKAIGAYEVESYFIFDYKYRD